MTTQFENKQSAKYFFSFAIKIVRDQCWMAVVSIGTMCYGTLLRQNL